MVRAHTRLATKTARSSTATVVIADYHPLFRMALRDAVRKLRHQIRIVECESHDALEQAMRNHVDIELVLLDFNVPGTRGFSSLIQLRNEFPLVRICIVSAYEHPEMVRSARYFGAAGFIRKSSSLAQIRKSIRAVLGSGQHWPDAIGTEDPDERAFAGNIAKLTQRQFRIFLSVGEGLPNKEIGLRHGISEATVKAHVTAILVKLGLHSRTQAALCVQKLLNAHVEPFALSSQPKPGRHRSKNK